jgi:hypothetical protein
MFRVSIVTMTIGCHTHRFGGRDNDLVITLMLVHYHTAIKVFHEGMVSVATG